MMATPSDPGLDQGLRDGVQASRLDPPDHDDQSVAEAGLCEGWREDFQPAEKRVKEWVGHGAPSGGVRIHSLAVRGGDGPPTHRGRV